MIPVTDADRRAAQELRVILADISGFWHQPGDENPLCIALARHRLAAEEKLLEKLVPLSGGANVHVPVEMGRALLPPTVLVRGDEVKLSA